MPPNQSTKTPDTKAEPNIKPVPMPVYPTMESLGSVIDLAYSQLPDVPQNKVMALFMTYHNTLLKKLEEQQKGQ
jgi:hypothetical protein